jgi:hypothetical protein
VYCFCNWHFGKEGYIMLVKKQPHQPQPTAQYPEHMRKRQIKNIKSKIRQPGITQGELAT